MITLLASAKTMRQATSPQDMGTTEPVFMDDARYMAVGMTRKTPETLAADFHCSMSIAAKTHQEYLDFFGGNTSPALLAYNGQAFKCLHADNFRLADWAYAQQHLMIVSFLYGLLRPLDGIHAYRMEGNVRPYPDENDTPFNYWKDKLTDMLIQKVNEDDGILVHLATKEFERLFHWGRIERETRLVQPLFLVDEGMRFRTVSMYAKGCRGAMARYIVQHRAVKPAKLNHFEFDGFRFDPRLGDSNHPHFIKQK